MLRLGEDACLRRLSCSPLLHGRDAACCVSTKKHGRLALAVFRAKLIYFFGFSSHVELDFTSNWLSIFLLLFSFAICSAFALSASLRTVPVSFRLPSSTTLAVT